MLLCCVYWRYVDTVAFGAWFVPSWCPEEKQVQEQKLRSKLRCLFVFLGGHVIMASRADDTASFVSKNVLPSSHVLAVGAP